MPSKRMSKDRPHSFSAHFSRSDLSPSITSIEKGPIVVSIRSLPSAREARTVYCLVPWEMVTKASVTPRFGYWPRPATMKKSPFESCMLK